MFDVSFGELALIGIVALLVVGPQKLPGLARTAGVWVGKTRRMIAKVRADVDREFKTDELRQLLTQQQAEMQELRQIIDENRTAVEQEIKQVSIDPASAGASPAAPSIAAPRPSSSATPADSKSVTAPSDLEPTHARTE